MTEKLLFAVHHGTFRGRPAGIIMGNHCLPVAVSHRSEVAPNGIHALWDGITDCEEFFGVLRIECIEQTKGETPGGLFVYETEDYDDDAIDCEDEEWPWLGGGEFRRPTVEELEPLFRGQCQWPEGKVL